MKWVLSLSLLISSLFAQYTLQSLDQKLLASDVKIIDIRTPGEWQSTGIVKGSIPIMFFDERGNYDLQGFLNQLGRHVKKNERFALICNSGSRSQVLGSHLGTQMGYNVVDLQGGVQQAMRTGIPFVPYTSKR